MAKKKHAAAADKDDASNPDLDEVEERQPLQCEVGDFIKVKQTLDEAVVKAIQGIDYNENYYWDNVKILLMVVACAFAMVAQFFPMEFPQSRPLLGVCCAAYFVASSILQLIDTYIEKDCIMTTEPKAGVDAASSGLRIRSNFARFQYEYELIVQKNLPESPASTSILLIYKYFTEDGWFDEDSFEADVAKAVRKFEVGKYD
eukprot:CAMPEP_0185768344 /NCGR_PEP_ID=MMETSP1174-20130828/49149_1 /TAXON_ID=35687 /ORGANISM="Dictyocha speculum, Strain CCMP1381" /LENGTH=201 /DNA_ID=CAMNT_0028452993 /DNA_START=14 /DNA_END=619 /DNA_ORIENTATION=-